MDEGCGPFGTGMEPFCSISRSIISFPLASRVLSFIPTVALVVKKGLCSYETKAEYASRNILPEGIVKFLIIDGETRIQDENEEDDKEDPFSLRSTTLPAVSLEAANKKSHLVWWKSWLWSSEVVALTDDADDLVPFPKVDKSDTSLSKLHDNDISVAILHVSYRSGYDLLYFILNEGVHVKMEGGTRVNLDGSSPPSDRFRMLMWVSLCVLVALGVCCCLAAAISNLLESQQPEPTQPQRPRRRRLTMAQVKEKIPVGIFNGTDIIFDNATGDLGHHDADENHNHDDNVLQPPEAFPSPQSLDSCTICLDDYTVGSKLRCLPCNHCFHARCISRWLVERSATCPLCKIDLYEEEEEEDEEAEDENDTDGRRSELAQTHLPGLARLAFSWNSVPPETATVPINGNIEDGGRSGGIDDGSLWRRARNFGRGLLDSAGQRRRRAEAAQVSASLAEPLLRDAQHQQLPEELVLDPEEERRPGREGISHTGETVTQTTDPLD